MKPRVIAFHLNLLQDVSVIRPLARLAADMSVDLIFLISPRFGELDNAGVWTAEIYRLAAEVRGTMVRYETLIDAVQLFAGRTGICIAGSESDLRAHEASHSLFRVLPASMRTITLQHGFECVGFLHNARHSAMHGRDIRFAADLIVGWFGESQLHDLAPTERGKLFVAGPTSLIEQATTRSASPAPYDPYRGIVCENTHSVRFAASSISQKFLGQMQNLANRLGGIDRTLDFRPHPAGDFLNKSGFALAPSMRVSNAPLYDLRLMDYAFAISAPSTVLFDFMLADVPVAVWGDSDIDAGNFSGLVGVSNEEDCWAFALSSVLRREALVERQKNFISGLKIPAQVVDRYRALLALATA